MKKDITWGRCSNYHWFDISKYSECPKCGQSIVNRAERQKLTKKEKANLHTPVDEISNKDNKKNDDKTKSMFNDDDVKTSAMDFGYSNFEFEDISSNSSDDETQSMFNFKE